jgi:flagellar hook assembly protein FlgD
MNESKIPGSPPVVMAIYDVPGNEANVLINQRQPAGVHQVTWDAKNQAGQAVPRGFDFIKMNCEEFSAIRKGPCLK